jgi:hypothetical protein
MRGLSADDRAALRTALDSGASYVQCAATLAETGGPGWTPALLRWAMEQGAPVRFEHRAASDGADDPGASPSVLEGMIESGESAP